MIVPGGGISADGSRWVSCRPNFFLPVQVLSRLFRRLFLAKLRAAHQAGRLKFFRYHPHHCTSKVSNISRFVASETQTLQHPFAMIRRAGMAPEDVEPRI
jgi:Putative transposase